MILPRRAISPRRYGKPEWGLDTTEVNGVRTPVEVRSIWEKPFCRLLHFDRKLTRPLRSPQREHGDARVKVVRVVFHDVVHQAVDAKRKAHAGGGRGPSGGRTEWEVPGNLKVEFEIPGGSASGSNVDVVDADFEEIQEDERKRSA